MNQEQEIEQMMYNICSYIKEGLDERTAILKGIKETYTSEDLRDIYGLFDITEKDLIDNIKTKLPEYIDKGE